MVRSKKRFKRGEYVVYHQLPRSGANRKLVGKVVGGGEGDYIRVSWFGESFPVIGWPPDRLEAGSAVDALAVLGRRALEQEQEPAPVSVGKRKSGVPVKITGAQLVTLRLVLAHHLWDAPDDEEMVGVLRSLPDVEQNSHIEGLKTRTIRVADGDIGAFVRALKLAGAMPHTPPGVCKALLSRAARLEKLSAIERLGKVV